MGNKKIMADLLNPTEIQERASQLSDPAVEGKQLRCIGYLKILPLAIALVNKLVAPSEAAAHHPDIEISYNKVKLNLTTHDAGGLTEKDLACGPRDFYARLKEFLLAQQEPLYLETVPARGKLANKKSTRG
jgi:4a-hydroxytetrahydrobiopterin dehydratase